MEIYGFCILLISGEIFVGRFVEFFEFLEILGVLYFVFYDVNFFDKIF